MSIATRTGDDGTTGLLHGRRLPKTSPRVEAIGEIDELSAALGAAAALLEPGDARRAECAAFQDDLSALMAALAAWPDASPASAPFGPERLDRLDARVAELEAEGIVFRAWNLKGFPPGAAHLELARAVCRRAERRLWAVEEELLAARPLLPRHLNRLSDVLWLLARQGLEPRASHPA